jgi:hypothetical protein
MTCHETIICVVGMCWLGEGIAVTSTFREEKRNALNLVKASVDAIVPLHRFLCKMIGEGISCVADCQPTTHILVGRVDLFLLTCWVQCSDTCNHEQLKHTYTCVQYVQYNNNQQSIPSQLNSSKDVKHQLFPNWYASSSVPRCTKYSTMLRWADNWHFWKYTSWILQYWNRKIVSHHDVWSLSSSLASR